jgi:DNA-binding XRE family transcriptional regulator
MAPETVSERLLSDTAPSRVADAAERLAGEELAEIEARMPLALAGSREDARLYVFAYGRLIDRMLEARAEGRPVEEAPWMKAVLWGEAMNAPFSAWVGSLGARRGTAVAAAEALRQAVSGGKPLSPPARRKLPEWDLREGDVVRFYRAVTAALEERELPLERVREVLSLNRTEAAALFGVRRQALEGWERSGVPSERQAKLATIGAIVDLLSAQLKADRIPAVVRRPAPAHGGRSILEAIAAGDEDRVLETLRAGFDWASGA